MKMESRCPCIYSLIHHCMSGLITYPDFKLGRFLATHRAPSYMAPPDLCDASLAIYSGGNGAPSRKYIRDGRSFSSSPKCFRWLPAAVGRGGEDLPIGETKCESSAAGGSKDCVQRKGRQLSSTVNIKSLERKEHKMRQGII